MMDPNNANGAADVLTPTGPNEYEQIVEGADLDPLLTALNNETAVQPDDSPRAIEPFYDAAITSSAPEPMTDDLPDPTPRTVTGHFINTAVMSVRAPFDAKKKRGAEYKAARTRLDKRADEAVIAFGREHLPELTADQVVKISCGAASFVGDSLRGFSYVEGE